ncbi:MAG: hypothetical protein EOP50_18200, partial [Sphingobacteriales bacterium]
MTTAKMRWATIHSVKGAQFSVVGLVLPKNLQKDSEGKTVIDHWEAEVESEGRRVLYVGASRAQQVLILAIHESSVAKIESILKEHFEFLNIILKISYSQALNKDILAQGELLSTKLFSVYLTEQGIPHALLPALEFMTLDVN